MGTIHDFFQCSSYVYNHIFADWLYIHFLLRTLILLLVLCILIYVFAQVFQYVIGPLSVLFFIHVLFRFWNFFVIETLHEWIFIHYYADEKTFLRGFYMRLCDAVKHNRLKLQHTHYTGILYRGRVHSVAARLTIILLVVTGLWTLAFGVYNEYAYTDIPLAIEDSSGEKENAGISDITDNTAEEPDGPEETYEQLSETDKPSTVPGQVTTEDASQVIFLHPDDWPIGAKVTFTLNRYGVGGSFVRDMPGIENSTRLEVVSGDAVLHYLNEYIADEVDETLLWMRVLTPSGTEGYISNRLLIAHVE